MRKLFFGIAILSLVSCAKKKWDKETLKADCIKEMKKDKNAGKLFTPEMGEKICDCAAEKTVATYKTEADASNDKPALKEIGRDCALELLGGGKTDKDPGADKPAADSVEHE
jgi:hypothetical protein